MTATTAPVPAAVRRPVLDDPPGPTPTRLVLVELRKMTDTRAGRNLLAAIVLVGLALVIVLCFAAPKDERTGGNLFNATQLGVSVLLPVLGVLSVTGEWSQRTALTTFALVPDRRRVVAAKFGASVFLAVCGVAVGLLVAVVARALNGVTGRGSGGWGPPPEVLATSSLYAAVNVAMGVAFGLVFLTPVLSILVPMLAPIVVAVLSDSVPAIRGTTRWVNSAEAFEVLYETSISAVEWARIGVAATLWLLVPLVIGMARVRRTELR